MPITSRNDLYDKISPADVYSVARDLCSLKDASWHNDPEASHAFDFASQLLIKAADSLFTQIQAIQNYNAQKTNHPDPDPFQNTRSFLFPDRSKR